MLKVAVGHSDDVDSLDAITEVLETCKASLNGLMPKAGILLAAIDFNHELIVQKVNDAFPDIELVGCTTDGEVSSLEGFKEDSVSLTLFCSDDIDMRAGVGLNISTDLSASVQQAIDAAQTDMTLSPQFCIVMPDGLTQSGVLVIEELQRHLGPDFPIFGGTAGDQWNFKQTFQFYKTQVLSDAFPVLLFSGPISFSLGISSGWSPIGRKSVVTEVDCNRVSRIGEDSAIGFYQQHLGEHSTPSAEYPLAVYEDASDHYYLRAPMGYTHEDGVVTFAGDVPLHATVQLTKAMREDVLAGTERAIEQAIHGYEGTRPEALLVFSCAARKQILGTRTAEEYTILQKHFEQPMAIAGFYCYGEIGPLEKGAGTRFHNETILTLLLGQ